MSSLPPALDFPAMELDLVKKWQESGTFQMQNKLSLERGDEVCRLYRSCIITVVVVACIVSCMSSLSSPLPFVAVPSCRRRRRFAGLLAVFFLLSLEKREQTASACLSANALPSQRDDGWIQSSFARASSSHSRKRKLSHVTI
jgi:hypothetical protein